MTATISGTVNNDKLTLSYSNNTATAVGSYSAVATVTGAKANNYTPLTDTHTWVISGFTHVVEDYKYAAIGQVMIRIENASGKNMTYEGTPIAYTTDANYKLAGSDNGVSFWLIPATDTEEVGGKLQLTAAAFSKFGLADSSVEEFVWNNDVNGENGVNVVDAGAVYELLVNQGAFDAYPEFNVRMRLAADTFRGTETPTADARGSIKDVVAILEMINNG